MVALNMELKLKIKKPKFWQTKWKIKIPVLYILEYQEKTWINTYWWGGNWYESGKIRFKSASEVSISINIKINTTFIVIGNTGTDLLVTGDLLGIKKISGIKGNKEGWTVFGEVDNTRTNFTPQPPKLRFLSKFI